MRKMLILIELLLFPSESKERERNPLNILRRRETAHIRTLILSVVTLPKQQITRSQNYVPCKRVAVMRTKLHRAMQMYRISPRSQTKLYIRANSPERPLQSSGCGYYRHKKSYVRRGRSSDGNLQKHSGAENGGEASSGELGSAGNDGGLAGLGGQATGGGRARGLDRGRGLALLGAGGAGVADDGRGGGHRAGDGARAVGDGQGGVTLGGVGLGAVGDGGRNRAEGHDGLDNLGGGDNGAVGVTGGDGANEHEDGGELHFGGCFGVVLSTRYEDLLRLRGLLKRA